MATLSEVLAHRAITKHIEVMLEQLADPDTGKPFKLTFRVPGLCEYADLIHQYEGKPDIEASVAVAAACLIDPNGVFESEPVQTACLVVEGDEFNLTRERIIERVLRPDEIHQIAYAITKAVLHDNTKRAEEEIQDTIKNC